MAQMTVMTGPERRRRWDGDERGRILEAAFAPGAVVAEVARQFDVATSLIYKWRRQALGGVGSAFAPAVLVDDPGTPPYSGLPKTEAMVAPIRVHLGSGTQVSIEASAPAALVVAVLRALR